MCGKDQGSDVQDSWSRGQDSRHRGRFRGIGKRLGHPKQYGALVDNQSFVLHALKCFGISCLSVSKVEVLEVSMEGKHLITTSTLTVNNWEIPTHALIDCEATGIVFMDQDFACHYQIPLQELKDKKQVEVFDGRPIESGDITNIARVGMKIQDHGEHLPMFVTKIEHYPFVLRIPWLRLHDVAVRFASNTVTFGSHYCMSHCHVVLVTVQGVTKDPPEPGNPEGKHIFESQIQPQRPFWRNILMLNGASFFRTVKQEKLTFFEASLHDINQAIKVKDLKERPQEEIVPEQYHEFLPLFIKVLAD
jgi:hypothetical protein